MRTQLLILTMFFSLASFAQGISNKITFKPGQKFEVIVNTNRSAEQELMGRSMESSMSMTMTSAYTVENIEAGQTTLASAMKRMKMDMSMMGREEKFDSDDPQDMKGEMGKMMAPAMQTKQVITLDENGVITAARTVDANGKQPKKDANMGMLGMLTGGMEAANAPVAGNNSMFKILPAKSVNKGDSWTDEEKLEGGIRKVVYTLSNVTDAELMIDFDETMNMDMKQDIMGQSASVIVKAKSNGKIVLDKATGLMKQKTFVTTSQEDISAGGMSIPSKSKTTTTITVKPVQ